MNYVPHTINTFCGRMQSFIPSESGFFQYLFQYQRRNEATFRNKAGERSRRVQVYVTQAAVSG